MTEADDWNTLQASAIKGLESIITPSAVGGDLTTQEIATYLKNAPSTGIQRLDTQVLTYIVITLLNRVYDLENAG